MKIAVAILVLCLSFLAYAQDDSSASKISLETNEIDTSDSDDSSEDKDDSGTGSPGAISTIISSVIQEALEKGDVVQAKISDTPKDYTMVEPTFRDQRIKNYIHQAFINFSHVCLIGRKPPAQPTPIVDSLKEEEKYGNDGDKLQRVSNFIVKSTEVATRVVGGAVSVPKPAVVNVSNRITQSLNSFGASIVGL